MGSQPAPIGTPPLLVFRIRNQLDSSISNRVPIRCRNTAREPELREVDVAQARVVRVTRDSDLYPQRPRSGLTGAAAFRGDAATPSARWRGSC
jgi:hypothetical protein